MPALPYIRRLRSFVLVLTPSVRPLWCSRVRAAVEVPPEQWTGLQAAFAVPVRDCS